MKLMLLFTVFLFSCNCNKQEEQTFYAQINIFQNEIKKLCFFIENESLKNAKFFQRLMIDAKIHCPDEKYIQLDNVAINANEHFTNTEEKLKICKNLENMITNGIFNGASLGFYISKGNYTQASKILDKWHQSFAKFSFQLHPIDIPLEIIAQDSNVFYLKKLDINECIFSWLFLVFLMISSIFYFKSFHHSTIKNQLENDRQANQQMENDKPSNRSRITNSLNIIKEILFFNYYNIPLILSAIVTIALLNNTKYLAFYPEYKSISWLPNSKNLIDTMINDRDYVHSTLKNHIKSIEEIKKYVNIYHDEKVQSNIKLLANNIIKAQSMAVTELQKYILSVNDLGSTLTSISKSIETKAIKAKRVDETKPILGALKDLNIEMIELKKNKIAIEVSLTNLLPILIKQTKEFRYFLQSDNLHEIRWIIDQHKDILSEFQTNEEKIGFRIDAVIGKINDDQELNNNIKELIGILETDKSIASTFSLIGKMATFSSIPFVWKSAVYLISMTNPVAGAAYLGAGAFIGAAGMIANKDQLEKQMAASNYHRELEKLNIHIKNVKIQMKQYDRALNEQKEARSKSQDALNHISANLGEFSKIKNFILPIQVKNALFHEIEQLLNNYINMVAFLEMQTSNNKSKINLNQN